MDSGLRRNDERGRQGARGVWLRSLSLLTPLHSLLAPLHSLLALITPRSNSPCCDAQNATLNPSVANNAYQKPSPSRCSPASCRPPSAPKSSVGRCTMAYEIPCWFMRGGTSRGPFFRAQDLPQDTTTRDNVIMAVLGTPDPRQIDGLGGATSLTSKVGILSIPTDGEADLDFLFGQIGTAEATVDTTPNCGNMLAAALPVAIEAAMLRGDNGRTTRRVRTVNTGV